MADFEIPSSTGGNSAAPVQENQDRTEWSPSLPTKIVSGILIASGVLFGGSTIYDGLQGMGALHAHNSAEVKTDQARVGSDFKALGGVLLAGTAWAGGYLARRREESINAPSRPGETV